MSRRKVDKTKAARLLRERFPGFKAIAKSASNNADPFFVYSKYKKYFVKVIDTESLEEEGLDEVTTLKRVKSRYVVELIDSGDLYDDFVYLQFPFIDGSTLDKIKSSEFTSQELEKLLKDVGRGIKDMHKAGIVHRDIKPKNIMRAKDGSYKLLDLGIGYFVGELDRDTAKERGSRKYSSPEQFLSSEGEDIDISFASDIFSLGVVAYQCATGEYPFEKFDKRKYSSVASAICKMKVPSLSSIKPEMPEEISSLIGRMLQKNQSERFSTPEEFLRALDSEPQNEERNIKIYIYNPEPFESFSAYYKSSKQDERADGVLLKISATDKRIKQFKGLGIDILLDPQTYQLPYRHKTKFPQITLRKALGVKSEANLSGMALNDDDFLKRLSKKVILKQKEFNIIILPYFAIRSYNDELIKVTKKVWRFHRVYTSAMDADVYGGLIIPGELLTNSKKRAMFLNRFMGGFDISGMYITFQNEDDSVFITNDETKLRAIKEIIDHFSKQGNLIIGKCDPAVLTLLDSGIAVTSGKKSERHLSYTKLDNPKKQKGSLKPEDIALRYFCEQLYDFLEEKSFLEAMRRFGQEAKIKCNCSYCTTADIFNSATRVSNDMHNLMKNHYYTRISSYVHSMNALSIKACRDKIIDKLEGIESLVKEISESYPGRKRLPDHEGLISAIKKS